MNRSIQTQFGTHTYSSNVSHSIFHIRQLAAHFLFRFVLSHSHFSGNFQFTSTLSYAPCQHYKHIKRWCDPLPLVIVCIVYIYILCWCICGLYTRKYVCKRSQLTIRACNRPCVIHPHVRAYVCVAYMMYLYRSTAVVLCAYRVLISSLCNDHTHNSYIRVEEKKEKKTYFDILRRHPNRKHCPFIIVWNCKFQRRNDNATKFRTHFRACQDTVSFK